MSDPLPTISFGEYALTPLREKVRLLSGKMPSNKLGRWAISFLRKLTVAGRHGGTDGPFDVQVAPGVRARLFPSSNLCEKRAFCGVQNWDTVERAALTRALAKSTLDPFIFLDVGANVGLYSLFLSAEARRLSKNVRIIAVEPDPLNRSRLEFNIEANHAPIEVEPVAIGAQEGQGHLGGGQKNRGEVRLSDTVTIGGTLVRIETLAGLIDRHGLVRIDAMKVDIEGQDLVALRAMFTQSADRLWPTLLIVEMDKAVKSELIDMILAHGYDLIASTGMNAILRRPTN